MKTIWSGPLRPRGTERTREGKRGAEGVLENISWVFPGENSLIRVGEEDRGGGEGGCGWCTSVRCFYFFVFWKLFMCVCADESLLHVQRGYVKLGYSWAYWGGGGGSDVIHQMEKADFSGVRFHGHPAPAVISAPQGPISTRADGRPWFPSARLNLALVPRGLKSIWDVWRKKKLENSRLHIVATLFRALGKVRHLDDVWNFTWKICGEKLKRGLSLDRQQQRLHDP